VLAPVLQARRAVRVHLPPTTESEATMRLILIIPAQFRDIELERQQLAILCARARSLPAEQRGGLSTAEGELLVRTNAIFCALRHQRSEDA
jgi:hypothetical protein